jgi:hypothetical protein
MRSEIKKHFQYIHQLSIMTYFVIYEKTKCVCTLSYDGAFLVRDIVTGDIKKIDITK